MAKIADKNLARLVHGTQIFKVKDWPSIRHNKNVQQKRTFGLLLPTWKHTGQFQTVTVHWVHQTAPKHQSQSIESARPGTTPKHHFQSAATMVEIGWNQLGTALNTTNPSRKHLGGFQTSHDQVGWSWSSRFRWFANVVALSRRRHLN